MIQIRQNCFETNSSSTHCLVINNKDLDRTIDENLFLEKYDIFDGKTHPMTSYYDGEYFEKIQDKLTYLVKIILMTVGYIKNVEDWPKPAIKLLNLLKEIFPNTDFSGVNSNNYKYYYEDGDYVLDDDLDWFEERGLPITMLLDKDILKHLFQYGVIYFGNRDDENFSNYIRRIEQDDTKLVTSISG